ncbi:MAG: 4-hydroxy-tetrahydrodipicolinate reductase [Candidatus Tectomicrobia bacterium]|nr:4-hydroxy-tetrahydrodipicolinate reductase [Candidatus Tectomicrobia bacterium]
MIRAIVTGASGRMGRRLIALMQDDSQYQLAGAVTHAAHAALGRDAGDLAGVGTVGIPLVPDLAGVLAASDVVIDFSVADASLTYLQQAAAAGKPMVIGTTGFTPEQRQEMVRLSQTVPCLLAPNMSVGVQVLFQLLRQAAKLLGPDFDVEIIEAHHRTKIDAPSGTALRMGDIIAQTRGQRLEDAAVHGRQGNIGRRSDAEIGIQAIRGGDIVGEHTVMFAGTGERIELIHRSQSRDNFVRGALRAAHWIVTQPPGLYGMEEMLQAL